MKFIKLVGKSASPKILGSTKEKGWLTKAQKDFYLSPIAKGSSKIRTFGRKKGHMKFIRLVGKSASPQVSDTTNEKGWLTEAQKDFYLSPIAKGESDWLSDWLAKLNMPIIEASLLESLEHRGVPLDKISVQMLGLSPGVSKQLEKANIITIKRLGNCTEGDLLSIDHIGASRVERIKKSLTSFLDWMSSRTKLVEASLLARLENEEAPLDRIGVEVLGLNERALKRLRKANIGTIQQLVNCAESTLFSIDGLGTITMEDIKNKLNSYLLGQLSRVDWESDRDTTLRTSGSGSHLIQTSVNIEGSTVPQLEQRSTLPTLNEAFNELFATLKNPRQSMILRLRYGLDDGMPHTLEETGQHFGITRERVRQIENLFMELLLQPSKKKHLAPFTSYFDMLFEKYGGIMTLKEIVNSHIFFEELASVPSLKAAELLLVACNKYNPLDYRPIKNNLSNIKLGWVTWYISEIDPEEIKVARKTACQLVKNDPLRYYNDELVGLVSSITSIDSKIVEASLRTCRVVKETGSGYGHLGNRKGRLTTSQMAIVALKELLVPAHYTVIHKKICEIFPNHNVDIRTLRNTLNSGQFRIIDRGIYGLLESNQLNSEILNVSKRKWMRPGIKVY